MNFEEVFVADHYVLFSSLARMRCLRAKGELRVMGENFICGLFPVELEILRAKGELKKKTLSVVVLNINMLIITS